MRNIFLLVRKEFLQIFRNKQMLPIIFLMPILQLVILVNAATYDVKNLVFNVVDKDHSRVSRELEQKFINNKQFVFNGEKASEEEAFKELLNGSSMISIIFPQNMEKDLMKYGSAKVQIIADAQSSQTASGAQGYAMAIISGYNKEIAVDYGLASPKANVGVNTITTYWYNPELNYKWYMAPGRACRIGYSNRDVPLGNEYS